MAALTWREVAAPDFGTSLQGIGQFSRLLDNAFSGAEQAVGKFDNAQDEMANRDILERMYAYNDPTAFAAAKADGSILGSDARRASGATLAALNNQVGTLQNQALGAINLESTGRDNEQAKYLDSIGAQALEWERLRSDPSAKGQAAASAYLAANPGIQDAAKLGYGRAAGILKAGMSMEEQGLGFATTRQQNDLAMRAEGRAAEQFDWSKVDRNEARQVTADYTTALAQGFDAESMEGYIADNKIGGQRAALLRQAFMGGMPGAGGGIGGGAGGGAGGGGNPLAGGKGDGSMSPFQAILSNEGGIDPKTGQFRRSSAGAWGPAQLMPGTAPEAMVAAGYSANDQRWKTDAKINREAGEAYYNKLLRTYGGDTAKAAAAYNAGPGNLDKAIARAKANNQRSGTNSDHWINYVPGETKGYVRNFVAKTTNPASLAVAGDISRDSAQRRILAKDPTGFVERVTKAQASGPGDLDAVANSIAKDTGADVSDVRRQLQSINTDLANNRAPGGWNIAGEIYRESRRGTAVPNFWNRWTGTTNAGDGQVIDGDAVRSNIATWKKNATGAVARDRMGVEGAEGAKAAALADHAAKYAKLVGLQKRRASGAPISDTVMKKAESELIDAENKAKELVGGRIAEDEQDSARTGLDYTGASAAAAGPDGPGVVLADDMPTAGSFARHAALGPAGIGLLGLDAYKLLRARQALAGRGQVAVPQVDPEPAKSRARGLLGYGGLGGDGFATTNRR